MGAQVGQELTREAVHRAVQLLEGGHVLLPGVGHGKEWLHHGHNISSDIRRFYDEFMGYGTVRAADFRAMGQAKARMTRALHWLERGHASE
jgi:hypothetical protein